MGRGLRWLMAAIFTFGLLTPALLGGRQQAADSAKLTAKERRDREGKLFGQLSPAYQAWLSQDVVYNITREERNAFLLLRSDSEREQFIEQFWQRRNPDPGSFENTFEEEHYRRILFANEHFGISGPGWKTDRGRIYILWGPPDEIETRPNGGNCPGGPESDGTSSTKHPWDTWHYRYLEGIGENVDVNFVYWKDAEEDLPMGDYLLTMDPCEAVVSRMTPGPAMITLDKAQDSSTNQSRTAEKTARLEVYVRGQRASTVKFKDLEAVTSSRIVRKQIDVRYHVDFLRATDFTAVVSLTIEILEKQISLQASDGTRIGQAEVFGRVMDQTNNRVVEMFEATVSRERLDSAGTPAPDSWASYQTFRTLRAGVYRLELAVKDVVSGNCGTATTEFAIPQYNGGELAASSLILGDRTESEFAMKSGMPEVRPRLSGEVASGGKLDVFLQVYGLSVDEKSNGNNASIVYTVRTDGRDVWREVSTSEELGQRGEELTIERALPVLFLEAGKYRLQIEINDHVKSRIVSCEADFTVKAAAAP
jgi:GWxTD domain-containing protein